VTNLSGTTRFKKEQKQRRHHIDCAGKIEIKLMPPPPSGLSKNPSSKPGPANGCEYEQSR
jgi:hypothetical protein